MRVSKIALAVSLVLPFHVVHAQQPPPVQAGQRIRVTAPLMRVFNVKGRWVEDGPDMVRMRVDSDGSVLEVPRSQITRLDVWAGRKSNLLPAAFLGLLVGASAAVATVPGACKPEVDCFGIGIAIVGFPAAGLVLGGTIGALVRSDRWKRISLDGNSSLTVAPLGDGRMGLVISVSF